MSEKTISLILTEIGHFFSFEETLVFDEQGYCMLQIEEEWSLILRYDRDYQRLLLMGKMILPEKPTLTFYEALLQFNFQKATQPGPWIALDAQKENLFLLDALYLEMIEKNPTYFSKRFQLFMEQYMATQGIFNLETWEAFSTPDSKKEHSDA